MWVDTHQPDVEAPTQFYGGLFGWTFEDAMPPGAPVRYVIAKLDGQDVGAIAGPKEGAAAWRTYVSVDDADAAAQRLVSAGATVRSAPAEAVVGGRVAVLTGPEGAEFRIWQVRRSWGHRRSTSRVRGTSVTSTRLTPRASRSSLSSTRHTGSM